MDEVKFEKIDKLESDSTQLYEKIIESISDKLAKGEYKIGDILPTERELAAQFGVSRAPVREALKILTFLGVVKKVGNNLIINSVKLSDLMSKIYFSFKLDKQSIMHLLEIRMAIEIYAASRAAQLCNSDDLIKMKKTLELSKEHMQDREKTAQYALEFHEAIIEASKNDILKDIYDYLRHLLEFSQKAYHSESTHSKHAHESHESLFEAILHKNPTAASVHMQKHLEVVRKELYDFFSKNDDFSDLF